MNKYEVELIVAEGMDSLRVIKADFCSIQGEDITFTNAMGDMVAFFNRPLVRCVRLVPGTR